MKLIVGLMLLLIFVTSFSTLFSDVFTGMLLEMEKMVKVLSGG